MLIKINKMEIGFWVIAPEVYFLNPRHKESNDAIEPWSADWKVQWRSHRGVWGVNNPNLFENMVILIRPKMSLKI